MEDKNKFIKKFEKHIANSCINFPKINPNKFLNTYDFVMYLKAVFSVWNFHASLEIHSNAYNIPNVIIHDTGLCNYVLFPSVKSENSRKIKLYLEEFYHKARKLDDEKPLVLNLTGADNYKHKILELFSFLDNLKKIKADEGNVKFLLLNMKFNNNNTLEISGDIYKYSDIEDKKRFKKIIFIVPSKLVVYFYMLDNPDSSVYILNRVYGIEVSIYIKDIELTETVTVRTYYNNYILNKELPVKYWPIPEI